MSAAAIAAACGFLFSPGPEWDALPLPPAAAVREVPLPSIGRLCADTPRAANRVFGCAYVGGLKAYVPTWASWRGTRACWLENRRHEEAHLKGWTHP